MEIKMIGIVVTSYRLPENITERWIDKNIDVFNRHNITPFLVSDKKFERVENVECPIFDNGIFSITRAANAGLKYAIESGMKIIIKTDIDCILSDDFFDYIKIRIKAGYGEAFRYWQLYSDGKIERDKRTMGTVALASTDWQLIDYYNDSMEGYGYDDWDVVDRARFEKIKMRIVREPKVLHIYHEIKHNRNTINPILRKENILAAKNNKIKKRKM